MMILLLTLASLLVSPAVSYESFFGSCPPITPMKEFDIEKFEGLWYVVESFDDNRWCVMWNITRSPGVGVWKVVESEESGVVYDLGLPHSSFYVGDISQPDPDTAPAKMRIRWRLSLVSSDFIIHSTDYENYAGVFECQNVGLFHRQNGVVLSRKPGLQGAYRSQGRLLTKDIKVEYYYPVKHNGCKNRPFELHSSKATNVLPAEPVFGPEA